MPAGLQRQSFRVLYTLYILEIMKQGVTMNMSNSANRDSERSRIFADLEWEVEERQIARRSDAKPGKRVNLTAEIERYLSELS